ncbi:MAG: cupin domain-containing protein [Pseudomonadota bacterium]
MTDQSATFCLSRGKDAKFEPMTGYRDWLKIRDLGLSAATNGQYDAWVTRANDLGGATGRHYHEYDFQIMFVTKGWVKMYYEGEGEFVLEAGDFVFHPPKHVHDFMDYSEDIEIFELASPANHHAIDV